MNRWKSDNGTWGSAPQEICSIEYNIISNLKFTEALQSKLNIIVSLISIKREQEGALKDEKHQ